MAQVAMPLVPAGPMRSFYQRLHALHLAAGRPSMRQIQRATRCATRPGGINPTTVHEAFSSPRLARWEVVEAVVHALGGDPEEIARLWRAAVAAQATGLHEPPEAPGGPRQLPPDVYAFTGRQQALSDLDDLLRPAATQPRTVVVSVLSGTAGVGKTALAVHWAHRVAGRFPDGQLYVDLRGYGPDHPVLPQDALAALLRALGVPGPDIPFDLAERSACFRSLLTGRRMLVLLDNAHSAEQVRPLLPASPSCVVLVTSRDSLAGLVARDGARRLDLDLLGMPEAEALLRTLIGARAEDETAAVTELATLCTRLPLALRIAAELAASRPAATLAELAAELSDEDGRLRLLDASADAATGVRSVFSWSYDGLPPAAANLFATLGLAVVPDIDVHAAAALSREDPVDVREALETLRRAHLVQPLSGNRYQMHDLLRVYAAEIARRDHDEPARRAAVRRLLDFYLGTAARAMDVLFPAESHRRPRPPAQAGPAFSGREAARCWLDDRRPAFVELVRQAVGLGRPAHAVALSAVLWRYLQNGAHHTEAIAIHTAALAAARRLTDRQGEGTCLVNLGTVNWRLGRYQESARCYEQAITVLREVDDRNGQARVLANLGAVHWLWGEYERAAASCQEALEAFTETADLAGEGLALDNLGCIRCRQGRFAEAADCHERAVKTLTEIDNTAGVARALNNLGVVRAGQQRWAEARDLYHRALPALREAGDRAGEADVLENMGNLLRSAGRFTEAAEHLTSALEIAYAIGNNNREVSALNSLGGTLLAVGRTREASARFREALATSQECGNRFEQARALNGLAATEPSAAHRRAAIAIFTELDVPEAAGGEVPTAPAG